MKNFITVLFLFPLFMQAQVKKNSVFLSTNYNLPIENSVYIDFDEPDFEIWSQPKNSFSFGAGYTFALTEYLGIGLQLEGEKIVLEDYYLDDFSASRLAFGTHFQTIYPQTPFHSLAGGYFNMATGNSDDFDNKVTGIEYGIFLGPAYTILDFEFALLFRPKFTYYFASGKSPDSGLIMYPRVSLQIGYDF